MTKIKPLPYAYDALEPYIDKKTMMIHHDKHHQAYLTKFEAAIKTTQFKISDVEKLLKNRSMIPAKLRRQVFNHGGGYFNHLLFWKIMKKNVPFQGVIAEDIIKKWGSKQRFEQKFQEAALGLFGSGWVWLVLNQKKQIKIMTTKNQDTPLDIGKHPLLALDVWEHAYYLKYKNDRAAYVKNFFKIINWKEVDKLYIKAIKNR